MDSVIGKELLESVTMYVVDILIASKNWSEHCTKVANILKKLDNRNVSIRLDKSILITQRITFLGYIISDKGFKVNEEKIKIILELPTLRNTKQLQSFLGLCN